MRKPRLSKEVADLVLRYHARQLIREGRAPMPEDQPRQKERVVKPKPRGYAARQRRKLEARLADGQGGPSVRHD